jgi:hypothetical protein
MPKSRSRKRAKSAPTTKIQWGGRADKRTGRLNVVLAAAAAAVVAVAAVFWWQLHKTERAFAALIERGQPALERVEALPDNGGGHLQPGQGQKYGTAFPTSGVHDPVPAKAGFYDEPQPPTKIVHALEHGIVVVYYDKPGAEALDLLKDWTGLYGGEWDGVAAVPSRGLGQAVVLTAWAKMLRLDRFEPAAAAAFIDAYRGRGPEHPVR